MDRCGVSGVPDPCINADRSAIVHVCHLGKPTLKLSDFDHSPIWGLCQGPTICNGVNRSDSTYQRAYKEFLTRLRQARIDAGLLQSEASALLGKSRTFVSKCELGERRVDVIEAQQFAKIYKKKFTYFQIL